jgi:hypothetical protein
MRDNGNKKEIVAFYSEFLFLFAVVGECGADDVKWFALYDASKALLLIGISAFFDRTAWMLGGGLHCGAFCAIDIAIWRLPYDRLSDFYRDGVFLSGVFGAAMALAQNGLCGAV